MGLLAGGAGGKRRVIGFITVPTHNSKGNFTDVRVKWSLPIHHRFPASTRYFVLHALLYGVM